MNIKVAFAFLLMFATLFSTAFAPKGDPNPKIFGCPSLQCPEHGDKTKVRTLCITNGHKDVKMSPKRFGCMDGGCATETIYKKNMADCQDNS